jgi:sulfate transport system ATP-binding protein
MRIEATGVSKRFGNYTALADVTLDVPEGSLTALLGPSGSGKSTLLRIIAGLEVPDAGTVSIDGADVTTARPQERGIGFVFQHYAAFAHMTVRDNVAFGLKIRKRAKDEIDERWPWSPASCCWTSRSGRSTRLCAPSCERGCGGCTTSGESRPCW